MCVLSVCNPGSTRTQVERLQRHLQEVSRDENAEPNRLHAVSAARRSLALETTQTMSQVLQYVLQ